MRLCAIAGGRRLRAKCVLVGLGLCLFLLFVCVVLSLSRGRFFRPTRTVCPIGYIPFGFFISFANISFAFYIIFFSHFPNFCRYCVSIFSFLFFCISPSTTHACVHIQLSLFDSFGLWMFFTNIGYLCVGVIASRSVLPIYD